MRGTNAQHEPERRKGKGSMIYLCPQCTGTITAAGITWQCSQPHPERSSGQREAQADQDIRTHIQFLLQQGSTRSDLLVLIWQQPTATRRARALQILRETTVSDNE